MKLLILDRCDSNNGVQLGNSAHIYNLLKSEGVDCIYHHVRSIADVEKIVKTIQFDKIFLLTLGEWGNNGTIQRVLDAYGIDYTFSDGVTSKICYNKQLTKDWLAVSGYNVPDTYNQAKSPCVCKTTEGEGSEGVYYCESETDIPDKKGLIFEEYLGEDWNEYTISILKGEIGNPVLIKKAGKIWKKESPEEMIVDFPEKEQIRDLVKSDFLKIAEDMPLKDGARIDFMVKEGVYKILEINTMPVLTATSVFCLSLAKYKYIDILKRIIE